LSLRTTPEGLVLSPQVAIKKHMVLRDGKSCDQIQVQWGTEEAVELTWEGVVIFFKVYPTLNLEGKVVIEWGVM